MRWLHRLWARFVKWIRSLRLRAGASAESYQAPEAQLPVPTPPPPTFRVVRFDEDPDALLPETLYAIGENGHLWHVSLICPCGCGAAITLNMLADASPCWRLYESSDGPTLSPSIWRTTGCRSHFILSRGNIFWCDDRRPDGVCVSEFDR